MNESMTMTRGEGWGRGTLYSVRGQNAGPACPEEAHHAGAGWVVLKRHLPNLVLITPHELSGSAPPADSDRYRHRQLGAAQLKPSR